MTADEAIKDLQETGANQDCDCGGTGYVWGMLGKHICYCVIDKMYEGQDGE